MKKLLLLLAGVALLTGCGSAVAQHNEGEVIFVSLCIEL